MIILIVLTEKKSRAVDARVAFNRMKLSEKMSDEVRRCNELSGVMLNDILGAAFNSRFVSAHMLARRKIIKMNLFVCVCVCICRYMSIDEPEEELEQKNVAGKRGATDFQPFYVEDTYAMEISDMPAWEVHDHHLVNSTEKNDSKVAVQNNGRVKRANNRRRTEDFYSGYQPLPPQNKRPWECEAKIKWLDLGHDYYPRYLRTVECTRHSCFYGHFTCKPRSFTVKILRRRKGECVQTRNKIGTIGLPGDLKELWVWEERAVNFCCDCAAK
jgi:hypothetical protein